MANDEKRRSFFDRAMALADRFFESIDKLKKAGDKARDQNVEIFDQMNPGFKNSFDQSMKKAADLGSKLEEKTEKILFGKDMYWGAGGEARKAAAQHCPLDDQIKSASDRAELPVVADEEREKEPSCER